MLTCYFEKSRTHSGSLMSFPFMDFRHYIHPRSGWLKVELKSLTLAYFVIMVSSGSKVHNILKWGGKKKGNKGNFHHLVQFPS